MPEEGFLRRWARLKADGPAVAEPATAPAVVPLAQPPAQAAAPAVAPRPRPDPEPAPVLPTLDDVALLDANSDFSAFVARGVDKDVRRLAMKKLFSDPHFNLVDKLDVYMDDYNKPSPMSAEMLAALHHTKNLFAPLAADKETGPEEEGAEPAGEDAAAAEAHAGGDDEPDTAATLEHEAAVAIEADATTPAQQEAIQFHVAAPSSVPQQTQQGKA